MDWERMDEDNDAQRSVAGPSRRAGWSIKIAEPANLVDRRCRHEPIVTVRPWRVESEIDQECDVIRRVRRSSRSSTRRTQRTQR
jgi:hypothetical protein